MRRLLHVLACCTLAPAGALAQQRTVTLAEAIDLAQRADPLVVQAQGTARTAGASVRQAWGGFLPSLGVGANYGKSFSALPSRIDPITNEVISGNITTGSVGLNASASIDLFNGFQREANLRARRAGVTDADAALANTRAQSALTTTTQFLQALQTTDLVRVREEAIRRAEEKLAIANAKLATRASTIADSLQAVGDLARARLQLLNERQNLTSAEATLARRVGLEGRVSAVADSSLFQVVTLGDTASLMIEAQERAPAVISAAARVTSARANLGFARGNYWPRLTLGGSTSLNGSSSSNYDLSNTRGFNVGLSWTLFDRFGREQGMVQSRTALESAQANEADARRNAAANLLIQLGAIRVAEQRIALTTQSLEAARASVRVQTERYRLGSISITEFNAAQDALSSAETEAVNARYEYLRAKAQIEAILGRKL